MLSPSSPPLRPPLLSAPHCSLGGGAFFPNSINEPVKNYLFSLTFVYGVERDKLSAAPKEPEAAGGWLWGPGLGDPAGPGMAWGVPCSVCIPWKSAGREVGGWQVLAQLLLSHEASWAMRIGRFTPKSRDSHGLSQVLSGNGSLVMSDGELSLAVLALSQAFCWVLRAQFPPESIQSGSG